MERFSHILTNDFLKELDRLVDKAVFLYDYSNGTTLYASPSAEFVLGYAREVFLSKSLDFLFSITHPDHLPSIIQDMASMLQILPQKDLSKIYCYSFECLLQHPDGRWIWMEVETHQLSIKQNGTPGLFMPVIKEISERKVAENYLWNELFKREPSEEKRSQIISEFERLKKPQLHEVKLDELAEVSHKTNPVRNLTDREKDVLKLISKGFSSKEIAVMLNISFNTIETHRKHLLDKFNAKNTAELIKEASKSYWLGN